MRLSARLRYKPTPRVAGPAEQRGVSSSRAIAPSMLVGVKVVPPRRPRRRRGLHLDTSGAAGKGRQLLRRDILRTDTNLCRLASERT